MSNAANTTLVVRRTRQSESPPWPPIAPCSLDEARMRSRDLLLGRLNSDDSDLVNATFSSTVKMALDPQGHLRDGNLRHWLLWPSPQHRGNNRDEREYDALHFDVPPIPELAPQGYDEIHLRNVVHHDILFAVRKQNKAEAEIKKLGYVFNSAVADAYLLIVLQHLRQRPEEWTSTGADIGGRETAITYESYHNLRDAEGIEPQLYHKPSGAVLDLGLVILDHALPDCEHLHEVYQKPYLVRRIEDLSVIKAFESLTKVNHMIWHVRKDEKPFMITASFYDTVEQDGQLGFLMEVHEACELADGSDLHGVCEGAAEGIWRTEEPAQAAPGGETASVAGRQAAGAGS